MSKRIFLATALIASVAAIAQDTTAKQLNEVVVTANKFPSKTSQTGKVVTIITQQDLARTGARDLAQVLSEQGGLYVNGAFSNPGKDKSVYLRGAKVDHTLITIDGVPLYDPSGIGSNYDLRLIPVQSVERIEILRGSQGTLYGSDAIAGVINIITKKGGTTPAGGSGSVSYGSFNSLRAGADVHGVLKKLDYSVGYNYFKTDGISEAQQPPAPSSVYDKDGFTQKGFQAGIGIQATANIRIQPYVRFSEIGGDLDLQPFEDEKDFSYTAKNRQAGVRNEIALGDGKLNLLYNYNRTNRDYLDDSVESRSAYTIFNKAAYKASEHFAEAYIVYPFQRLKLTAGADFRASNTDFTSLTVSPSFDPAIPFPFKSTAAQSGDTVHQKQFGFYTSLVYQHNSVTVEGGGRYNHHSVYGSNAAFNFNPSLLLQNQWKLFANLSSGYKTPSLYQLYSEYGNLDLNPEKSVNLEGGLQYYGEAEKGTIRATYFYRDVTDVLAFLYNPVAGKFQYTNQDKQKDQGVEVDAKWKLTTHLDAKFFYTYLDGNITTKNNGKDTTYFNLIRRPKSSFTATLGYNFFKTAYVGLQVSRFGKRSDLYFDPTTFERQDITLRPYTLLNLYAEYGFQKVKFFADLHNITGEKYTEIYGYSTPRFNGYGGVRFTF